MVGLQESSARSPDGWPPQPGPRCSPVERRKRREQVEKLLVDGLRAGQTEAKVSAEFGVLACQVRTDIAWVQRQWDIEDRRHANRARQRVRRRLQRHAGKLEEAGKHAAAALVEYRIGRLRGMGLRYELEGGATVKHQVEVRVLPADAAAWWQQLLAGAEEQGRVPAGTLARLLPAERARGLPEAAARNRSCLPSAIHR